MGKKVSFGSDQADHHAASTIVCRRQANNT